MGDDIFLLLKLSAENQVFFLHLVHFKHSNYEIDLNRIILSKYPP